VVVSTIGQHPQLFGLPELKLFAYPTLGELDASLPAEARERGLAHRSPGLARAVAELELGGQSAAKLVAALDWLRERSHWGGEQILDLLMERISPRIAVEKSPENVAEDRPLKRLDAMYPRARYIHLTRHPIATVRSIDRHLTRRLPGYQSSEHLEGCIEDWLAMHQRIVRFTSALPQTRWLRVKAEHVLSDPTPHLTAIAAWLSIRTDAAAIKAMQHPERSPFACFAPAVTGVSGGHDPDFLSNPRLRRIEAPDVLDTAAERQTSAGTWVEVVRVAHDLGYVSGSGTPVSRMSRSYQWHESGPRR
jgi:Sulfotransferase family